MKLQNITIVGVTDYYSRVVLTLDDSNIYSRWDTTINLHSCACVHFLLILHRSPEIHCPVHQRC